MSLDAAAIARNLATVKEAIARAARDAGRAPESVRLVAVSKLQPVEACAAAVAAGQLDLGENYAQELRDKAQKLAGLRPRWHVIGPLQRNKVKYVVGVSALIHTVDNFSLAEDLSRRAATMGITQDCLIQVNIGDEQQKSGCAVDDVPELIDRLRELAALGLRGLMCIPPATESAEEVRPYFRRLAEIAAAERARTGLALPELSMGMSADYTVAIAEGATIVRVGTAIFGERPAHP